MFCDQWGCSQIGSIGSSWWQAYHRPFRGSVCFLQKTLKKCFRPEFFCRTIITMTAPDSIFFSNDQNCKIDSPGLLAILNSLGQALVRMMEEACRNNFNLLICSRRSRSILPLRIRWLKPALVKYMDSPLKAGQDTGRILRYSLRALFIFCPYITTPYQSELKSI